MREKLERSGDEPGERHRKDTRSPAVAHAAGGDCVASDASDAAGGEQGYEMYFPRFVVDGAAGSVPRRLLLER